jgi:hypothetical protein
MLRYEMIHQLFLWSYEVYPEFIEDMLSHNFTHMKVVLIVCQLNLQVLMQSVPITTNVVSSKLRFPQ